MKSRHTLKPDGSCFCQRPGKDHGEPNEGSHTDGQGKDDLEIPRIPKRPPFDRRKDGGAHEPKDEQARERPSEIVALGQEFVPRGDLVDELDLVGQRIIRAGVLGSQLGRPVDPGPPEVLAALRSLAKVPDDDADFVGELGDGDDCKLRGALGVRFGGFDGFVRSKHRATHGKKQDLGSDFRRCQITESDGPIGSPGRRKKRQSCDRPPATRGKSQRNRETHNMVTTL